MLARLSAFVIWALVAATAVFWGLRLFVRAPAAPAYTVPVGDVAAVRGDLTRLLGTAPVTAPSATAAPEASARFRLLGIVAPKYPGDEAARTGQGVALMAIDGKMPKAYAVGAQLDNDLVLQSVSLRTVSIASSTRGAPTITLQLPPPAAAATGTLPATGFGGVSSLPTPPAPVPQYTPPPIPQVMPQPGTFAPVRPETTAPTQ